MFLVEVAFSSAASATTEGSTLTFRKNVSTPPRLRSRWALVWMETNRSARFWLAMTVRSSSPTSTSDSRVRIGVQARLLPEQLLQGQGDGQVDLFLLKPAFADRPGPRPAVAGIDDDRPDAQAQLAGQRGTREVRVLRVHVALDGRLGLVAGLARFRGRRGRGLRRAAGVDVDDQAEGIGEVVDAVRLDPREIDVDDEADRRGRLLGDPDLGHVIGLDRVGLALEDGIQLGLQDVDVDPARVAELAERVLAQLADVEDDAGEIGVGEAAQVDDLDPRIGLPGRGRRGEDDGQEDRDRARGCGFQFISIL